MHCESASWSRPSAEVSTMKRRTFAHPDQPMADLASGLFRLPSRSVVEYFDLKFCYPVSESNACFCRS
jgi:hypothetical protein